jgi:hypothetical protein
VTWQSLLSTALVGTDRTGESAARLLPAAAEATVRRRAGRRPGPPLPLPATSAADARPELPEAARRRLTALLAERRGGDPTLVSMGELLPQWLAAARGHGYRAPRESVPALLDAGRARSELRADVVALAGPLGRRLAEANPDWRYVLRTAASDADAGVEPDLTLWQEGLFAERVTQLTRLRRRDPGAGLELLRSTWRSERAEDRLLFLDALQDGLSLADEPFLEEALSDRAKNVRTTAAELLSALPGSALSLRMADRASACVRLTGTVGAPLLEVEPPRECDTAMRRDGIAPTSPTGRGDRAYWLGEIVAAAPLSVWTEQLGSAERMVAVPVAGEWRAELHDAWARAAVRQADAAWAHALLNGPTEPAAGTAAKLLTVLPPEQRAAWTARFLTEHGLADAFQLLVPCTAPWPRELSQAVVSALARAARRGGYPWSHSGVLGLAERSLAPETAPLIDELGEAGSAAWAEIFANLAGTLRLRATMLSELSPAPCDR